MAATGLAILGGEQGVRADGPISIIVTSADDSAFPTVTAVVLADQDGKPLSLISTQNLTVTENDKPADLLSLTPSSSTNVPLELVLVVDTSGSMAGPTLTKTQAAATGLLKSLRPGDRAALISFDTQVRVERSSTADLGAVIDAVGRLSAHGNTALYDAVARATDLVAQAQVPRRAVVLLTDGEDYGGLSKLTRDESLARAVSSNTIFYTVGVGSEVDATYLADLANRSGGRFFPAAQASDLAAAYEAIQQRLRSYFVLKIHSNADAAATSRTIRVSLQSGVSQYNASLSYTSFRPVVPPPTVGASGQSVSPIPQADSPPTPVGTTGGSVSPVALFTAVLIAGVPLAALLLLIRRRRRPGLKLEPKSTTASSWLPLTEDETHRKGVPSEIVPLFVLQAGESRSVPLVGTLRIGTANDNEVILNQDAGIAPHHARIWVRDGRVMLHHLAPGFQTIVREQSVDWASVEPDEPVHIGTATLLVGPRPLAGPL